MIQSSAVMFLLYSNYMDVSQSDLETDNLIFFLLRQDFGSFILNGIQMMSVEAMI